MIKSSPESLQKRLLVWLELFGLLLILSLAAYLRLVNIKISPGWYSDEGTLINIADNLLDGHWQYFSLNQSSLIVARPPLFVGLLSGIFRVFGVDITVLRGFTGLLGVLAVFVVYVLIRRVHNGKNPWLALLSALMLAIYPEAVLFNRLGFSYNLLAVFSLLACLGLYEYVSSGRRIWLIVAGMSIGLGTVTDIMMFTLVLPALLIISMRGWRNLIQALLWMALPGVIYVVWMLIRVPSAFLFDARFTISRLGSIPAGLQIPAVIMNYFSMINRDHWAFLGIIGLFVALPFRWRGIILLMVFLPLITLGRTTWYGAGLGTYYIIPLLPFFAIGMGSLVWAAGGWVFYTINEGARIMFIRWGWIFGSRVWWRNRIVALSSVLGLFLIIILPFLLSTATYYINGIAQWSTDVDPVLVNAQEASNVLDYINSRVKPDDLVIASPAIAWGVHSNSADFQQTLIADGIATHHFPADIPANRFVFDPRYHRARYIVIDPIWRNWAAMNMPEVAAMMEEVEDWPLVFRSGEVQVYSNPAQ